MQLKGLSQPFLSGISKKFNYQPNFGKCTCQSPCDKFQKQETKNTKTIDTLIAQSAGIHKNSLKNKNIDKEEEFLASAKEQIEQIAKEDPSELTQIFNYESEFGPVIHPELPKMALNAVKEYGKQGDSRLIHCLVHHIGYSKNEETKNIAAETIIKLFDPEQNKPHVITMNLINGHKNDDLYAAKILGSAKIPERKNFLFYLAHPRNPNEVRIEALKGLAKTGDDMDVYEISKILKEPDGNKKSTSVKIQAMKTIKEIGSPDQIMKFINPMIDSDNPTISKTASDIIEE